MEWKYKLEDCASKHHWRGSHYSHTNLWSRTLKFHFTYEYISTPQYMHSDILYKSSSTLLCPFCLFSWGRLPLFMRNLGCWPPPLVPPSSQIDPLPPPPNLSCSLWPWSIYHAISLTWSFSPFLFHLYKYCPPFKVEWTFFS